MSILLNASKLCMQHLELNFNKLSLGSSYILQNRTKITISKPRLRNPVWFIKKTRTLHDDFITSENKTFIQEVVQDKFGPPAIINGVQTFQNSSSLVKGAELPKEEWSPGVRRTGVIAKKIGQYPLWKKDGTKIRTTLLQIIDNHVIKYIPPDQYNPTQKPNVAGLSKKRFGCLLVGAESTDPSLLTKDYCGLFKDSGVMPKKILSRFIISPKAALLPGTPLDVSHFQVGSYIDVRGKTIDRGFQGVVKRHGFKGMPASHGVTKTHRRPGNIGAGGQKARVWPGTKLPGHMGNRYRYARGLKIWRINTKYNVMWVTGSAIPGETNSMVYVFDTLIRSTKLTSSPPFPTGSIEELTKEDIWSDELHDFSDPSIFYNPE